MFIVVSSRNPSPPQWYISGGSGQVLGSAILNNNISNSWANGGSELWKQSPIVANKPIMVAQFMSGACQSGLGDPEMIYLSPIEQSIGQVGFFRNTQESIQANFVNIIIPDSGGAYGAGNGSYIYNKGETLNIEMRNGGNGRIQLKAGSKTASFDMNGNFCIGTTCMTETQLATMKAKTGV
jgi:hypothetical protein